MINIDGRPYIYDVFIREGVLYLISTYYNPGESGPDVFVNGTKTTESGYNHYEPMKYYHTTAPANPQVTISINGKDYDITADIVTPNAGPFAVATLFKDDHHRISDFVKYYRAQGVTNFYLYYNGKHLPVGLPRDPGIQYRTWDFPYYNDNSVRWRHNAQMPFLTSIQLRYRSDYTWFGLIDLDEFVFPPVGKTVWNVLQENAAKFPVVKVQNFWGVIDDDTITYTLRGIPWHEGRTKCFYNKSFTGLGAIHSPKENCTILNTTDMKMLHLMDNQCEGVSMPNWRRVQSIVEPIVTVSRGDIIPL
jgi:hypothetical protein